MSRLALFASAPRHLGSLLAEELRGLGIADASETRGGARFSGTLEDAYRVCLWSRVANRVLLPLTEGPVAGPDGLHALALELPWEEHLTPEHRFAVRCDGRIDGIDHPHFAALRVKDAIADRFNRRSGRRPSVDAETPDLLVHVHGGGDSAIISLDLAGRSLHQRGYRTAGGGAPLKENLAAALLLRAGWPALAAEGAALLDPMCGSGTLLLEGAMIAADIAPGLARPCFGFHGWLQHRPEPWQALIEEAKARRAAGLQRLGPVRGYDADARAVHAALENIACAGLAGHIHVERRELANCRPGRSEDRGLVIANPPYGERLASVEVLPALYARLGALLREHFVGWRASVLVADRELGHRLGLRAERRHRVDNGPIECTLLHFAITPESFARRQPRPLPAAQRSEQATMLANRLQKNIKALQRWRRRESVDCLRVYDADIPEYALAVDLYEGERRWVQVQEYAAPATVDATRAKRRVREALGVIGEVLQVPEEQLFFKVRRQQKGASQYQQLDAGGQFHAVREGDCRLLVNFTDYLDTGLFLDHREVRRRIGALSAGQRFLNLFSYTASATVHAALGGARCSTSVDLSATYLDWAAANLRLNGIDPVCHELIRDDCREWLARMSGQREYDLILLDPPTFSASKRMQGTLDIQRDQVELIRAALTLLTADGLLIFSTNLRRFQLDVAALDGCVIRDIGAATRPRDFARNPRIHHCWEIRRNDGVSDKVARNQSERGLPPRAVERGNRTG